MWAPDGYRCVGREAGNGTARLEVVEDKAEVVRRIFRWVGQERVSLAMVSRRLFEAGVPSPTGKARRSRSMVWVLLPNPAYAGQALFGKNASIPWQPPLRPARGRNPIPKRPFRQVPAPPESRIAIPVPPLVEAALSEGAQEQLDENRRRNRQRLEGRPLPPARLGGLPEVRLRLLRPMAGALPTRTGTRIPLLPLHRDGE